MSAMAASCSACDLPRWSACRSRCRGTGVLASMLPQRWSRSLPATTTHLPRSLQSASTFSKSASTSLPAGVEEDSSSRYPQSCSLTTPSETAAYPDYEEEHETFASAFSHAFDDAKPERLRTKGLQEFAGALWERRRHIPSMATDPLLHVFTEFDLDRDGRLTAAEIASALQSRAVMVTVPQIQWAIDAYEESQSTEFITAAEWPDFVFALAAADLRKDHDLSGSASSADSVDGDILSAL